MEELPAWLSSPHGSRQLKIVDAEGCHLYESTGKRLLDFTAGWNVANFGWRNEHILHRALHCARTLTMAPAWCVHEPVLRFSENLSRELGRDLAVVTAATGTQAVEFALRIARRVTGRTPIISVSECYHGSTSGSMAACGIEYLRREAGAGGAETRCLPLPGSADEQSLLEQIRNTILTGPPPAAILMEPVFLNVGGLVPSTNYLRAVFEAARQCGALVVMDEISTGMGRVRPSLGYPADSLVPDVLVLGKSLGGGVAPLSAVVVTRDLATHCRGLAFDSTFAAIPYACEAGIATLEFATGSTLLADAAALAGQQRETLRTSLDGHPRVLEIRGQGCLTAIEFRADSKREQAALCDAIIADLLSEGIFIARSRWTNSLLLMPPLTISTGQYDQAAATLVRVLETHRAVAHPGIPPN